MPRHLDRTPKPVILAPERITITLPYSLVRVPFEQRKGRLEYISLLKNSQLRALGGRMYALAAAKRQVKQDVAALMLQATWPALRLPLTLSATIYCRTAQRRDDDGGIAAIYPARDAMATALGIDDADITVGTVRLPKGEPERTEITLEEAK